MSNMIVTGTGIVIDGKERMNSSVVGRGICMIPFKHMDKVARKAERVIYDANDETAVKAVAELMRSSSARFMPYMNFSAYAAYISGIGSIDRVRKNYPEEQTNFGQTEMVLEELVNKVVYYLGIRAAGASAHKHTTYSGVVKRIAVYGLVDYEMQCTKVIKIPKDVRAEADTIIKCSDMLADVGYVINCIYLAEQRIRIVAFRGNADIKEAKRIIKEQFVPWG